MIDTILIKLSSMHIHDKHTTNYLKATTVANDQFYKTLET